jgi:hypothetical protein
MIRTILKWFISRSLDHHARLPRWLRGWIDRDHELRHFELHARQLGSRLKRDAPAWVVMQAVHVTDDASNSRLLAPTQASRPLAQRRIAWSLAAGALAASVVFVLAHLPSGGDQVYQPDLSSGGRPIANSRNETSSALKSQWMISAWKTGRTSFHQLKAQSVDLRSRLEIPKMPVFSTIGEPSKIAGSIAGRIAAGLDSSLQSQWQQFTSELQSAFSFFTHRLPATAARLVGLRSNQRT